MINLPGFPKIERWDKEPKVFSGGYYTITEKLDGSQIKFAKIGDRLILESKNKEIDLDNPDKMFKKCCEELLKRVDLIPNNYVFYGEYLKSNKHNSLRYDRVPNGNIALFGIRDPASNSFCYENLKSMSQELDLDIVPFIEQGQYYDDSAKTIGSVKINQISQLGGCQREGVVILYEATKWDHNLETFIQNYHYFKIVSEEFKEVTKRIVSKQVDQFETFKDQFKTKARWEKAINRLRDANELSYTKADIGNLMKEISCDLEAEEKEAIQAWLWQSYGKKIIKNATNGFPEFYKKYLEGNDDEKIINN